ncbi:RNA polymerase II transcription factor B subunit 1 [Coemansia aciculifera]|uniref:RNA polymerase II transcription factor B subunit 1 n=1 Tax=Coemansia aciculifera TaxID=417176 RepID=A0ACC1M954_9FUNG|nr:RNA polymerase II transcription factor B subunit 1 [Coemansia aciculifera]
MLLLPGESIKHTSETTCNKEDGSLYFTNKRLAWCKAGSPTPTVEVLHDHFSGQQVSKAETKKVMLRVTAAQPPGASGGAQASVTHTFTWKHADKDAAIADREKYVAELSVIMSKRSQGGATASGSSAAPSGHATSAATPGQSGESPSTATAAASASASGVPGSSTQSASEYVKVKIGAVPASAEEIKLRQDVLSKNAELAKLHKSLVVSGLVPEDEFWSTRKHILETQAIQSQLRKGESSTWLDLAPTTQESGNFKYTITPSVARRVFKEFPQVKRAYVENVPHRISEKQFWKSFVASQFFNRGRSAEAGKGGGRDAIFDKCTQEEDALFDNTSRHDLELLNNLLNLTRTEEDSVETGNAADFTMRPASKDSKLALIRRFNRHSELVLQSVLGNKRKPDVPSSVVTSQALESATVLNDLAVPEAEKRVKLNIQDKSRYFTSMTTDASNTRSTTDAHESQGGADPLVSARSTLKVSFDISRPLSDCGDVQATMASMLSSAHRQAMQRRPNRIQELHIPDDLSHAVAECHGAGTEMLRHLWALLRLPPTADRQTKAGKIVVAFDGVLKRIDETIAKARVAESKNANIATTVERMLQPITTSLRTGKQAYEHRRLVPAKSAA